MKPKEELIADFIQKKNVYAVVGVSDDRSKFGSKIFFDLKEGGYDVFPVHPSGGQIDSFERFKTLADLPVVPDVVDVVVPPPVTERLVQEAHKLGIRKIWMQPGTASDKAILFCQQNGIEYLSDCCVMVERRRA